MGTAYDAVMMRELRQVTSVILPSEVRARVASFGLCRHRGRRGGRRLTQRRPRFRRTDSGAYVVVDYRPAPRLIVRPERPESCIKYISTHRCDATHGRTLTFGCLNIRSLSPEKLDDFLSAFHECSLDVALLCETWHDPDSIALRRLRADGFTVVERARPRSASKMMSLSVNHGGVIIVAAPSIRLTPIAVSDRFTTFEVIAACVSSGYSSCILVDVYRPGSAVVTPTFFKEFSDLLDQFSSSMCQLFIAGDLNIRLDRNDLAATREFTDLLSCRGLQQHVSGCTHDAGGTLDVVCSRVDLTAPSVDIIDVGLSDHRLLRWKSHLQRPPATYTTEQRRVWRMFDSPKFMADLALSPLCDVSSWDGLNGDDLVQLYDCTISRLLDDQVPIRTISARRRSSVIGFDHECRLAKRHLRKLERIARRNGPLSNSDSQAARDWRLFRTEYTALRRRKCRELWHNHFDANHNQPRRLWQSFEKLFGNRAAPTYLEPTVLHSFFDEKVAGIRDTTADAPPPTFSANKKNCHLEYFRPVSVDDVTSLVRSLPNKQCALDPLPTWLLKECVHVLSPFLAHLFNWSLLNGVFPVGFKGAYITPLLKKPDLDSGDVRSYRPISNLSVLSKLLERLVCQQLMSYLHGNGLLPPLQSAYTANHSTETAILKVLSDILLAVDSGNFVLLTMLDLSAAFDTVDHVTLIRRLEQTYGLQDVVLSWFSSYLHSRTQYVKVGQKCSAPAPCPYGVPQGSVLGPILFLLYAADVLHLVHQYSLTPHAYADDLQVYSPCRPEKCGQLINTMSTCIEEIAAWMRSNRLQLNPSKTEVIWFASKRQKRQPPDSAIRIGSVSVLPVTSVRDLGVYIDADLSMSTHVNAIARSCFAALRQIRSVRRSLPRSALLTITRALVVSRIDYCISVCTGLPSTLLDRLQSVMNTAARLIFSAKRYEHITPLLHDLHWLRIPERILFRLCLLAFKCLQGTAPSYLSRDLRLTTSIPGRRSLRSSAAPFLIVNDVRRCTFGGRAFPVAASRAWNSLPSHIRSSRTILEMRRNLKTFLFRSSFPITL